MSKKMMKLMKAKVTLMLILVGNDIMVLLSLKMTFHGSIICMFDMVGFARLVKNISYNEVHARGTFAVCSCVNMEHPIHAFKQYEKLAKYQRLERKLYKSENELKKH